MQDLLTIEIDQCWNIWINFSNINVNFQFKMISSGLDLVSHVVCLENPCSQL